MSSLLQFPSPPTQSSKIIRNLGVQFCEMNPECFEDEILKRRKKSQLVIRKKKGEEPKEQVIDEEEGSQEEPEDKDQA